MQKNQTKTLITLKKFHVHNFDFWWTLQSHKVDSAQVNLKKTQVYLRVLSVHAWGMLLRAISDLAFLSRRIHCANKLKEWFLFICIEFGKKLNNKYKKITSS